MDARICIHNENGGMAVLGNPFAAGFLSDQPQSRKVPVAAMVAETHLIPILWMEDIVEICIQT